MAQSSIAWQQSQFYPNIKIPKVQMHCKALGHIYNVLIILAITLLMAVVTTVLAYFADLIPSALDNGTSMASNMSAGPASAR